MIHTRISGTGSYLPGEPVSNAALIAAHGLDSSDEWIVERTGIRNRHLAAPGVTMLPVMRRGRPAAAIRMSARRVSAARSAVREWQMVMVACSIMSRSAMGLPTMLLRPTTTQCLPEVGIS